MNPAADAADHVNPHFLEHLVKTDATRRVEVTEDVVAGNGMKLLAKGARIDAAMCERLLQHKLQKPLEQCVQVVDGVIPERFGPIADDLLDRHALLASLCSRPGVQTVPASLTKLRLTPSVRSLLTVYGDHQGDRLEHSVGVAMIAMALARTLLPGDIDRHRMLALAGLLHDVGELYIDPRYLERGLRLEPTQWRHIASHPVVGHRVLNTLEGAGPAIAQAVLQHHERLDGFGYPRGLRGEGLSMDGQILAAAEWLMALIENGAAPVVRASIATKLMPGEFSAELLDVVASAAAGDDLLHAVVAAASPLEDDVGRITRIAATLRRFAESRAWIEDQLARAGAEHRQVLQIGFERMLRIQTAFSSTGLDSDQPGQLMTDLTALNDSRVHLEVTTIVRELEWRLREIERESLLRASLLTAAELAVTRELVDRLKGGPR